MSDQARHHISQAEIATDPAFGHTDSDTLLAAAEALVSIAISLAEISERQERSL